MRAGSPLPEKIEIALDSTDSIRVPDIYSEYEIGTELDIEMRQVSQYSFVTLE